MSRAGEALDVRPGWSRTFGFLAALLLGAACVPAAVLVSGMETKYMLAAVAGAAGIVGLSLVGSFARARLIMVVSMALGLSIGLSISFLHQLEFPHRYLQFVGGALAVTVSLGQLGALGWLLIRLLEARLTRRAAPLRMVPLIVWPQVLFMAIGIMTLANALYPVLVWLEILRLAGLLMISVAVMNLSPRELQIFIATLVFSILPQIVLVGVQAVTGHRLGLGVLGETALVKSVIDAAAVARPGGTFGDPNVLSYFFEITYPVALALALTCTSTIARLGSTAAAISAVAGTFLSFSRAAWSTIPISTIVVVLSVLGRRVLSLRTAAICIVGSIAASAAVVAAWPMIEKRLFGDDAGSLGHRMPLAKAAISMWEQFPWFGVGLNNFAVSFNLYDRTGYSRLFSDGDHVVHNLHLLVLSETGLIGYAAFLFQFVAAVMLARRINRDPWNRALAIGICMGFLAHLIHGCVDPGYKLSLTVSQLIAGLFGLLGALWLRDNAVIATATRDDVAPRP